MIHKCFLSVKSGQFAGQFRQYIYSQISKYFFIRLQDTFFHFIPQQSSILEGSYKQQAISHISLTFCHIFFQYEVNVIIAECSGHLCCYFSNLLLNNILPYSCCGKLNTILQADLRQINQEETFHRWDTGTTSQWAHQGTEIFDHHEARILGLPEDTIRLSSGGKPTIPPSSTTEKLERSTGNYQK